MKVTPATLEDAPAIAKAHVASWQAAYAHILDTDWLSALSVGDRTVRWRRALSTSDSTTLVAKAGSETLGFVSFGHCRDEGAPRGQAELWALYVSPEAWGRGAGRMLIECALNQLKAAGYRSTSLWVLEENHRGRRFYEAFGFRAVPGSGRFVDVGGTRAAEVRYLRAE